MTTELSTTSGTAAAERASAAQFLARPCPYEPPPLYRLRRTDEPVSRLAWPGGETGWLLTRYSDVRAVLSDPRFSSQRGVLANPIKALPPGTVEFQRSLPAQILTLDPPEHTRYRRTVAAYFTVRRMRALAAHVAEIVADHLDALAATPPPADLVAAFALPIPSLVICEMLGVPYADRAEFQRRSVMILAVDSDPEAAVQARHEIRASIHDLAVAKRRHPADDMLSDLTRLPVAEGGLDDEEVASLGTTLLIAGHETTANMLSLGTLTLLEHPAQLAALRADPALLGGAVEELLRYLTILQFGLVRTATEDVEIGGQLIRAGEPVLASLVAANRDPHRFPDPETLDVTRAHSAHVAFGHGVHQCVGQQLARVEMKAAFGALLERFPTLRLAVPLEEVPVKATAIIYGPRALPVTWDPP
jgi:cytochrome P450